MAPVRRRLVATWRVEGSSSVEMKEGRENGSSSGGGGGWKRGGGGVVGNGTLVVVVEEDWRVITEFGG
ncbi:hypothetical protein Hanom_Chr10g00939441 [Helianthus anomalus]